MAVPERDRQYFKRIGAFKEASHARAAEEHQARSLDERLARSWALYLSHRGSVDASRREDDPSPFFERARRLGLYRG